MKRVLVMLVTGTVLSGAAALYATSTASAVEPASTMPQPRDLR